MKVFRVTKLKIWILIGALCFAYGLTMWILLEYYSQIEDPNHASSVELPLGSISGIAVDNEGYIYCGTTSYQRIQIYDQDGRFVKGLFLPGLTSGWFEFRVDDNKNLHISMFRGNRLIVLDKHGMIVTDLKNQPAGYDADVLRDRPRLFHDSRGNIYQAIYRYYLFPAISKTDIHGTRDIVVRQQVSLWLMSAPFPAFGFQVFGIVLIATVTVIEGRNRVRVKGEKPRSAGNGVT